MADTTADAGKDQAITIPQVGNLDGTNSTADGSIEAYLWEYVSGPSTGYTIADPAIAHTSVSFSKGGTYVFQLTVTDDLDVTDTDTVTFTVTQHGSGPGNNGAFEYEPPRGNIGSPFFKTTK